MDPISGVSEAPKSVKKKIKIDLPLLSVAVFIILSLAIISFLYFQNLKLKSMLEDYRKTPNPVPTFMPTSVPATPYATESAIPTLKPKKTPVQSPIACTADAKLCPDGSYVGRTAPKCEFAPCP